MTALLRLEAVVMVAAAVVAAEAAVVAEAEAAVHLPLLQQLMPQLLRQAGCGSDVVAVALA